MKRMVPQIRTRSAAIVMVAAKLWREVRRIKQQSVGTAVAGVCAGIVQWHHSNRARSADVYREKLAALRGAEYAALVGV